MRNCSAPVSATRPGSAASRAALGTSSPSTMRTLSFRHCATSHGRARSGVPGYSNRSTESATSSSGPSSAGSTRLSTATTMLVGHRPEQREHRRDGRRAVAGEAADRERHRAVGLASTDRQPQELETGAGCRARRAPPPRPRRRRRSVDAASGAGRPRARPSPVRCAAGAAAGSASTSRRAFVTPCAQPRRSSHRRSDALGRDLVDEPGRRHVADPPARFDEPPRQVRLLAGQQLRAAAAEPRVVPADGQRGAAAGPTC